MEPRRLSTRINRRSLLTGVGLGSALLLAACQGSRVPEATATSRSVASDPIGKPDSEPALPTPTVASGAAAPATATPTVRRQPTPIRSGVPLPRELETAQRWFARSFQSIGTGGAAAQLPFSFSYDNRESPTFLPGWRIEWEPATAGTGSAHHRLTLSDPRTGLQCRCEITTFADFPAIEWVVHFKNTANVDTPIIAKIRSLDVLFPGTKEQVSQVHHASGSSARPDDFAPQQTPLPLGADLALATVDGRSSSDHLPFFNLELGDAGVIGALGWTGRWQTHFQRDGDGNVQIHGGLAETHLKLLPDEEIRTPRGLLLFWEGDQRHGHNLLRQFILAYHTPRPNGKPLVAPICVSHWGDRMDDDQIAEARWLKQKDLAPEYFWIDAGWHGDAPHTPGSDTFGTEWVREVGNWYPRKSTYPNGLKPVGDALKALGLGFLLWFEPERVYRDTQIAREHPEWLLGPVGDNWLFDLGIPEARRFLTDKISALISQGGITAYRQDFNMDPTPFWIAADSPDRVGMAEIRHIEGLYAFWDELLTRHPGLIIDNCASGGRRIDLETISRSIPLWRSDYQVNPDFSPTAMQNQTQGLAPWVPLSTGFAGKTDTYAFRSALGPGIVVGWGQSLFFPADWARKRLAELEAVRQYFSGDFYPLTAFSLADDAWAAWQFHRSDLSAGVVLALRRPQSPMAQLRAPLFGLDPAARYEVRSVDADRSADDNTSMSLVGRELLDQGLAIEISEQPGSVILTYKEV